MSFTLTTNPITAGSPNNVTGTITVTNAPSIFRLSASAPVSPNTANGFITIDGIGTFNTGTASQPSNVTVFVDITINTNGTYNISNMSGSFSGSSGNEVRFQELNPTTYTSTKSSTKSGSFTKNDCLPNEIGSVVLVTQTASYTFTSNISQLDADLSAQNIADLTAQQMVDDNGQVYANNNGFCEIIPPPPPPPPTNNTIQKTSDDISLIKLYKNDFTLALMGEDPPMAKDKSNCFIKQKPNEFFRQTTSSSKHISFVSTIRVELVNCCGEVKKDITTNFSYSGFQDRFGIQQITFEFGYINEDFWTETLYLKITDLTNLNVWYSSGFLVTDYESEQTTTLSYKAQSEIYGVDYDLANMMQHIRVAKVYYKQPNDEEQSGQYIDTQGNLGKFKTIHTPYDDYKIDKMSTFMYRRLQKVLSHPILYVDGLQSKLKDGVKKGDIQGTTNWFDGSFTVNRVNRRYTPVKELLPTLTLINTYPIHNNTYTLNSISQNFYLEFNMPIEVVSGTEVSLYLNDNLAETVVGVVSGNFLLLDFSGFTFVNGNYKLTLLPNKVFSGFDFFAGLGLNDLNFVITEGDYSGGDYDNNDYLTDL